MLRIKTHNSYGEARARLLVVILRTLEIRIELTALLEVKFFLITIITRSVDTGYLAKLIKY